MNPIDTKKTSRVLRASLDWDESRLGKCVRLPVVYGEGFLASYWKASWRERLLILLGRPIRLCVVGEATQPPVMLDTEAA